MKQFEIKGEISEVAGHMAELNRKSIEYDQLKKSHDRLKEASKHALSLFITMDVRGDAPEGLRTAFPGISATPNIFVF